MPDQRPQRSRPIQREEPDWSDMSQPRQSSPSHPDLSGETKIAMMLIDQVCARIDAGSERQAEAIEAQAAATSALATQLASLSAIAPDARKIELEQAEQRGRILRLETQGGDHELRIRPLETSNAKLAVIGLLAAIFVSATVSFLFSALRVHAAEQPATAAPAASGKP